MVEPQFIGKAIDIVSVEPALVQDEFPVVSLCIDDGSDRYYEYVLTDLQKVRSLIALLLQALACHGDLWADDIYRTYIKLPEPPESL